jgi:hypothetical protein
MTCACATELVTGYLLHFKADLFCYSIHLTLYKDKEWEISSPTLVKWKRIFMTVPVVIMRFITTTLPRVPSSIHVFPLSNSKALVTLSNYLAMRIKESMHAIYHRMMPCILLIACHFHGHYRRMVVMKSSN